MNYGYIRVSTKHQNTDRQIDAMKAAGIASGGGSIFIDKQSGKNFDRPAWMDLCSKLQPGDCVFVLSLDRMGRDYLEIQEQWRYVTKFIGADIVVMDMPLLDTRKSKDLLGTLISDLVLQLLAYVAQSERERTHERQMQGIASARARGVKFGRKPLPIPENFEDIAERVRRGEISQVKAAAVAGMSRPRFRMIYGEYLKSV